MTIPGVQKPHCRPWCSWKDRWSGWSSPPEASASIVVTSRPSACTASSVQDLTDSPSISTVHAPQLEVSQPTLVPMSPSRSRRKYTRRVRGSTSSSWVTSLTVIDTRLLPIRPPFRHRRPSQHDMHEREAGVGCVEEGATERPRTYIGEVMRHQRQPPSGALSRPDNSPEPLRYTRPRREARPGGASTAQTRPPSPHPCPEGDPGEAAAPLPPAFLRSFGASRVERWVHEARSRTQAGPARLPARDPDQPSGTGTGQRGSARARGRPLAHASTVGTPPPPPATGGPPAHRRCRLVPAARPCRGPRRRPRPW